VERLRATVTYAGYTHLSFRDIAEGMFLSRHTIKAEAMSLYRKLRATSRSPAVARSRELGLLEG
jgi:LuxR family transcriptional regulator, maltose regulon positive regulatory protein